VASPHFSWTGRWIGWTNWSPNELRIRTERRWRDAVSREDDGNAHPLVCEKYGLEATDIDNPEARSPHSFGIFNSILPGTA